MVCLFKSYGDGFHECFCMGFSFCTVYFYFLPADFDDDGDFFQFD